VATDSYGQSITLYQNSEAPNLESMIGNLATGVIPRSVMRFASASARSATLTSPVEGMVTWLQDVNRLDYYDGSVWVPAKGQTGSSLVTAGSSSTTSEVTTSMSVTLPTRAGVAYELKATALLRSTVGGDRLGLRIRRGTTTAATQVGGGIVDAATPNTGYSCLANGIDTPGSGSTTWTVFVAREGGTGSVDLTASTTLPASFVVREI
jgi:hypothetical protein